MNRCLMLVGLLVWRVSTALYAGETALSKTEMAALLNEGNTLFHEANEMLRDHPESARDTYRKAALRFERIVRDGGIDNGFLYYNIGNARFLAGDIGRAILNYRRAELYMPNNVRLQQNLDYARSQRTDRIEVPQQKRILATLFFWHYDLAAKTRFYIFAVCFAAAWILAGIRLFARRPSLTWSLTVASLLSLIFFGSLLVETAWQRDRHPGVIVTDAVTARKGDSESYEPSFTQPLHAGTEFVLIKKRRDWYQAALADGNTCWLPEKSAELVR